MHVLSGSRTFRAGQMSGSYMHPQKLPGMGMNLPQEGMRLPGHSRTHVADSVSEYRHNVRVLIIESAEGEMLKWMVSHIISHGGRYSSPGSVPRSTAMNSSWSKLICRNTCRYLQNVVIQESQLTEILAWWLQIKRMAAANGYADVVSLVKTSV